MLFRSHLAFYVHLYLVVGPGRSFYLPRVPQRPGVLARFAGPCRAVRREPTREHVRQHAADWGPGREHARQHADRTSAGLPRPAYRLIVPCRPHSLRSERGKRAGPHFCSPDMRQSPFSRMRTLLGSSVVSFYFTVIFSNGRVRWVVGM